MQRGQEVTRTGCHQAPIRTKRKLRTVYCFRLCVVPPQLGQVSGSQRSISAEETEGLDAFRSRSWSEECMGCLRSWVDSVTGGPGRRALLPPSPSEDVPLCDTGFWSFLTAAPPTIVPPARSNPRSDKETTPCDDFQSS